MTQCGATVAAATYGNGTTDAGPGIQTLVDACPTDEVLLLGAGTFTVNTPITLRDHKLLRGSGMGVTILQKRNNFLPPLVPGGPTPNGSATAVIQFGPMANGTLTYNSTAINLTSDAIEGAFTVTVPDASLFVADQIVKIDQDDWTTALWAFGATGNIGVPLLTLASDTLFMGTKCIAFTDNLAPVGDDCVAGTTPGTNPFPASGLGADLTLNQRGAFNRLNRFTNEIKEVASVNPTTDTITFKTPLHTSYAMAKEAQIIRWVGASNQHTRWSGVEDLSIVGGGAGTIRSNGSAYSWVKNVDSSQYGSPIDLINTYKFEIRDSTLRDVNHPYTGGGGYCLSFQNGTSEVLIENNVVVFCDKSMVIRSSGAGSVVGYNYMDDAYVGDNLGWQENGMNSAHGVGSHHILFEGNYSHNYDGDDAWGTTRSNVVLRNHISGHRASFGEVTNTRAVGAAKSTYWQAIIGNVLGLSGIAATWIYEDPADGTYGGSSSKWGLPAGYLGTIYRLGYSTGSAGPVWGATYDPEVKARSTFIREGNYDYVTSTQKWDRNWSPTIPNTLYLPGGTQPSWWAAAGGGTWPWVQPGGGTKLFTLPAKVRHDAMVAAATVPSAPTISTARAENSTTAMVTYFAPVNNGGRVITGYTATSSPGGLTATNAGVTAKPVHMYVSGLLPNTSYTFTVTATNSIGTSAASAASNSITNVVDPPPTSAIDRVQEATGVIGGATATNTSAVFTNDATVGNLIVVIPRTQSGQNITAITDTQGNMYTQHLVGNVGAFPHLWVYSTVASQTGPNTVTCTFGTTGVWRFCDAIEYEPGDGAIWSADPATRFMSGDDTTGTGLTDIVERIILDGVWRLARVRGDARANHEQCLQCWYELHVDPQHREQRHGVWWSRRIHHGWRADRLRCAHHEHAERRTSEHLGIFQDVSERHDGANAAGHRPRCRRQSIRDGDVR